MMKVFALLCLFALTAIVVFAEDKTITISTLPDKEGYYQAALITLTIDPPLTKEQLVWKEDTQKDFNPARGPIFAKFIELFLSGQLKVQFKNDINYQFLSYNQIRFTASFVNSQAMTPFSQWVNLSADAGLLAIFNSAVLGYQNQFIKLDITAKYYPDHCDNGVKDLNEPGLDCGGPCHKCHQIIKTQLVKDPSSDQYVPVLLDHQEDATQITCTKDTDCAQFSSCLSLSAFLERDGTESEWYGDVAETQPVCSWYFTTEVRKNNEEEGNSAYNASIFLAAAVAVFALLF